MIWWKSIRGTQLLCLLVSYLMAFTDCKKLTGSFPTCNLMFCLWHNWQNYLCKLHNDTTDFEMLMIHGHVWSCALCTPANTWLPNTYSKNHNTWCVFPYCRHYFLQEQQEEIMTEHHKMRASEVPPYAQAMVLAGLLEAVWQHGALLLQTPPWTLWNICCISSGDVGKQSYSFAFWAWRQARQYYSGMLPVWLRYRWVLPKWGLPRQSCIPLGYNIQRSTNRP